MKEEYAIRVQNLSKVFGHFRAVDGISFDVQKGSIFGLLGANGAGKSTTIRMLCGLLLPTSGEAVVGPVDVSRDPERVKRSIGYMSQEFSLYNDLTVEENINFFGGVYDLSPRRIAERRDWILSMSGLKKRRSSLTSELSGGLKQRLALGCAVIHSPPIVFLDEPTGGVDPISRREFWTLINQFAGEGITVLVTTHYMDEAEYCNEIVFMHAGAIIARGSPAEIKQAYRKGAFYELECDRPFECISMFKEVDEIIDVSLFGTRIHVHSSETEDRIRRIAEKHGQSIASIRNVEPGLEDVFIGLIEHSRRETEKV